MASRTDREKAESAYEHIANVARENGLVLKAGGGIITIVHPMTQDEMGISGKCLWMSGLANFPERGEMICRTCGKRKAPVKDQKPPDF